MASDRRPILVRPIICAVSNRRLFGSREDEACAGLVEWSAAIGKAGVDLLQIREGDLGGASLASLTRAVLAATADTRLRIVVNDRADVAVAAGAAGVHLPAAAPPASAIRGLLGHAMVVGRSVHAGDDLTDATGEHGCDYLTFGTVFPSTSKPPDHRIGGVSALRRACASSCLPVLAIGGITVQTAAEAALAGAAGIAAIGLFVEPWVGGGPCEARDARLAHTVAAVRAGFAGLTGNSGRASPADGTC